MMPERKEELLKQVHAYYPLGMPELHQTYSGTKILESKVEQKIKDIIKKRPTAWTRLLKELKREVKVYPLYDFSHLLFPNYLLEFEFPQPEKNGINVKRSLVLIVSLLVNYYTIYFEERIQVNHVSSRRYQHLIYGEAEQEQQKRELVTLLKGVTEKHFPEHRFFPHKPLFDHKIVGGTLYGNPYYQTGDAYSIFQFLFHNEEGDPEVLV